MAKPADPTLTDYAVTAISPILIMAMVGSLVFFLVEVLYDGRYPDRLLHTLFFFVIGTVLIARIMIEHGANRALLYAAGLAAATFLALQAFVSYPAAALQTITPFINAGLMALIWWSANKLTWDCTHIDEDRPNAGKGVLDAATEIHDEPTVEAEKKKDPPGLGGWLERWQRHRRKQLAKPHTPGVWVLYFALAALPIFGLGQSLIPSDDAERRRTAFNLMVVYVGSALGLLAATTLLGLRKYLRDRGAAIPGRTTAGWLGLAAVITIAFLLVASVLPRPYSETPLVQLPKWAGSKDRQASKNAQVKDGSHGDGEGADSGESKHDDQATKTRPGEKGPGERTDQQAQTPGNRKGEGAKNRDDETEKGKSSRGAQDRQRDPAQSEGSSRQADRSDDSQGESESRSESTATERLGSLLQSAGSILKWLAWAILAFLVLAAVVIFFLRYLAPFTAWARGLLNWLGGLFRRRADQVDGDQATQPAEPQTLRPPPFSSFGDPFTDGGRRSVDELVSYSFRAFESWAWERGLPRGPDETPQEFARRVEAATGFDSQPLVKLYGQVLYSQMQLAQNAAGTVKSFWRAIPASRQ